MKIVIFYFFIISVLALPGRVFCYDTSVAHPNIAQMSGLLFNQNSSVQLSAAEISWIMSGAEDEDMPTRWMNHFYDPLRGIGLKNTELSAKNWAQNPRAQVNFALGDNSWQRALDDFKYGDKESAFKELGHVLHLVADMYVPAHTRDDMHPTGDSYEQFVKNNWDSLEVRIKDKANFTEGENLEDIFDSSARYSNSNFYSDDTVEDSKYDIKDKKVQQQDYNGAAYKFFATTDQDSYKLFFVKNIFRWQNLLYEVIMEKFEVGHDAVLTDYALRLIPKAIGQSAGVIKLFFTEAERIEESDLPDSRVSLGGRVNQAVGLVINAGEDLLNYLKSKFGHNNSAVGQEASLMSENNSDTTDEPLTTTLPAPEPKVKTTKPVNPLPAQKKNNKPPKVDAVQPTTSSVPVVPIEPVPILPSSPINSSTTPPSVYFGGGSTGGGGGGSSVPTIPSPIEPTTSTPTSTSTPSPKDTTPPAVPLLDTLFSQIIYTTSSAYDIYGSCATDTLKILSSTSSLPFAPSSTFWNFNAPLFPGHNYFSFAAVDVDFNTSTFSDSAHIVLDNEPPLAPIIATEELMATSGLKISLSGADDLSPTVYDLFYQVYSTSTAAEGDGDSASSSVWTTIVTSTPETSVDFSATRGESYLFRARATDILGHVSPWSDEASASVPVRLDWSKQVVINEIGWAGTRDDDSGRADEWVELYNNTDEDIDLTNWKLIVTDRPIVFSASTTIRAHSYFLMERTDDLTVKNIPADYIFTLSGNMKNSGEKLQLVDGAGEIIDEVDCEKGWYAGQSDSEPFLSMARVDPKGSGNNPDNWLDASGPWKDALTYDGYRLIYGSPRESNSRKLTVLSGTQIDSELNLSRENGPYFLDNYTLPAGATLRMDAGTEINLPAHGGFVVNGILEINGSAEDPVVFQPVPSSTVWGNIIFTGADVNIQYANFSRGNYETIIKNHGALFFVSSTAVLDHVLMWNNRDPGISINAKNSNLTVKNSSIGYDEKHDIAAMPGSNTTGINIREGGELNLENVLFTNLTLGVSGGSMHDPDFPKLKINLMPPDNFVNVDYPWQPTNWLELISPTSTPE